MRDVWLGLDVGTTAVKAAAYTRDGAQIAIADAPSQVRQSAGGCSEQDMTRVWEIVCAVLSEVSAKCRDCNIVSLGVAAQGDGFWAVDADGAPAGPAILWNDTRSADDIDQLAASGAVKTVAKACHTSLWPGTSGVIWRNLPEENQAKIAHVFTCGDWIGLKLTGVLATDFSNATIPFLDLRSRSYSQTALEALDCGAMAECLLTPKAADGILGPITRAASELTGLPVGLPVNVPTLDLSAMIVGMGLQKSGDAMMIMGTTAVVNILTESVEEQETPVGASVLHPAADVIVRVLAPTTGAAAFDWFAGLHPMTLGGENAGIVAEKLNALVEEIPPGANGVTFLPYLNGERAPFVSPRITASFHGLRATSTKADMGRAVMEGAAMSLRHCLEMEGKRPEGVIQLTGGGSKNPLWCQIIADVVGTEIAVSEGSDHGLWGAACLGAAAAGYGSVSELVVREDARATYVPDPGKVEAYHSVFKRYQDLSDAARAFVAAQAERKAQ